MKLEMGSMTERDKKLLVVVGVIAFLFIIIYFCIMPLRAKISEYNEQLDTLETQESNIKSVIEANANIDQELADAKAKMNDNSFLAQDLTDVDVDRVIQQVAAKSGVKIISNEIADATVMATEDFSVSKPALVYTIRDTKAAMDEDAAKSLKNDMDMENGIFPGDEVAAEDGDGSEGAEVELDEADMDAAADTAEQTPEEAKAAEEQEQAEKSIPVIEAKVMLEGSREQLIGFVDNFNKLHKSYVARSLFITSKVQTNGSSATRGSVTIDAYFVH
jgi:hypothetical protein